MKRVLLLLAAALALAACDEDQAAGPPPAVQMTAETLGHYCQMHLTEHPGPKAQVHLEGIAEPLFFSQVRDAVAYQRMPEQAYAITAIYVSDMGVAASWEAPGNDNWIPADSALFVVGSKVAGGMGAPELVPFSSRAAAEAFVSQHGGAIQALDEIPDEAVLAPVEYEVDAEGNFVPPAEAMSQ